MAGSAGQAPCTRWSPPCRSTWGAWTSSGGAMLTGRAGWAARGPPCCQNFFSLDGCWWCKFLSCMQRAARSSQMDKLQRKRLRTDCLHHKKRLLRAEAFCRLTSFWKDVPASHRDAAILLMSIRPGKFYRKISRERQQVLNSGWHPLLQGWVSPVSSGCILTIIYMSNT